MAQYIKQANIFGRLGTAVGKGLAEQIPKEIERTRLQAGLEDLATNTEGMTPFQRFAKLSGVPGITPQAIQSGSELLRQEAIRNSFRNQPGQPPQSSAQPMPGQQGANINDVRFANLPPDKVGRSVMQGDRIPTDFATRGAEAAANQGLVRENPAQAKFVPVPQWTPEQRNDNLGRLGERHPELSFEQLQQLNADDERRYLEAPAGYRQQRDYMKGLEDEADAEFDRQLQTTLQKEGKDTYGDLTGETQLDIKKSMRHDLATNPNLTIREAAEKWVKKGKDFVDTKNQVREMAERDFLDKILPHKKESNLKALKEAQKSYDELGRKREFYNMLRSNNKSEEGIYGFGLSPGAAALIAYPRSQSIKSLIKSVKHADLYHPQKSVANTRKLAEEFSKNRTNSDSILAFTREMSQKFPQFNTQVFLDYLRDNKDEFNFNPDQLKEIQRNYEDFFPNWGDLALFPYSGASAAHD
jgi:hypothetical protein